MDVISISHVLTPTRRPLVSISTVITSFSPEESPLVGVTVTQPQDSDKLYVRVPVPLFQISKVVDSTSPP